jgi:hypothetical protein
MKFNKPIHLKRQFTIIKRLGYLFTALVAVGSIVFFNTQRTSAAPGPITGSVFNDVNGNGVKDSGEGAFSNVAIVNLYNSSGAYVKSRTSDSSGNFSLAGLSAGTYYISLYNTTRAGIINSPPALVNSNGVHVEQTYAGVGSGAGGGSGPICVGASPTYTARTNYISSPSEWTTGTQNGTASGPCFGGRKADMTNTVVSSLLPLTYPASTDFTTGSAGLNTQKSVTKVVLTADSGISNVDFGFSTNAVTNTEASGQGSLSQFITNANTIGGAHAMHFVPSVATNQGSGSNKWWQINQGASGLPTITNSDTTLDGRAWSNTDGTTQLNTNTGTIAGSSVGTTAYQIDNYNKPELEVVGDVRAGGGNGLFTVSGSNVAIANFGINSTVNYPSTASSFVQQTGGTAMTVNDNLMGVNVATGTNYSTRPQNAIQTAYLLSLNSSGLYQHNYISANDTRGMTIANATSLLLGDWVIEDNSGPSAGVSFSGTTVRVSVRHNTMPTAWLDASLLGTSLGIHTLTENTITGGEGVVLFAGLQNTITKNVITSATSSNPGISVGNLSTGNYISQNSFSGNGGNAIDLNSDGVSDNALLGCVTLSPTLISLANLGIARPTISNARLQSGVLTLDIGYCGVGVYNVEIYKAAPGSGDDDAGEGVTYLGTFTGITLLNGVLTNQTMSVTGLNPGDAVTAIVVNPITGDTSEFGPNVTAASVPTAPTVAPDMTSPTDTGSSNTDNITANATPAFTGSCANGQTVTLYVDDVSVSPTQVCSGGTYSIPLGSAVIDGSHTIASTFTNATGESDKSPTLAFTIDAVAPATPSTPTMTTATDTGSSNTDGITSNPKPVFTGTCTDGDTISLFVDGSLAGTQVCSGGTYSIQPTSNLTDGSHTVTVSATDAAGNQSPQSTSLPITIDTSAPTAPVITSPANSSYTNDNTPTFSGTGETGAIVIVKDNNGVTICTVVVVSSSWSCNAGTPLIDGAYTFTATQTDPAGNVSPTSSIISVTIDTVAPNAPVITTPVDNSATNDNTPTISGTADANAAIELTINGTPVTFTANGSGNWSYTPTSPLADGAYSVTAIQSDLAGNVSPVSTTTHFTVDTVQPGVSINKKSTQPDPTTDNNATFTIVFSEPIDSGTFSPSDISIGASPTTSAPYVANLTQIDSITWEVTITGMPNHTTVSANLPVNTVADAAGNGNTVSTSTDNSVLYEVGSPNITKQVTNDPTPVLDGECITGHDLQIALTGPVSHTYTTTCGASDLWNYSVPDTLPDGVYTIVVTDTTVGGLTNQPGNQTDALVIDTVRPSVTVDQAGDQTDPTSSDSARFIITFSEPISGDTFEADDLTISGTSGTAVITQIDATTWQVEVTGMTSNDTVAVSLDANKVEDIAGNGNTASTSTDNSVIYDATAPTAPVITSPTNNSLTNNPTVTVQGTGEDDSEVTVIVDGAAVTCTESSPVVVSGGVWTCTPSTPLSEGPHTITANLTDAAGNISSNASTINVTVDTIAPNAPDAPIMTSATDTGASNSDGITNIQTPAFTGPCTASETIRLYDDATLIAEGVCTTGTYTLQATSSLGDGEHTITATATDQAGNTSDASAPTTITIDTSAPSAPVISSPIDNTTQANSTLVINGTGEIGAVVNVSVDGSSAICNEDPIVVSVGATWTCTLSDSLNDGTYAITALQTDVAGNQSPTSSQTHVTIDTTPPATLDAPTLENASDSGSSNTDHITNVTTPIFTGTCENGTLVKLYIDGLVVGQTTCTTGIYQVAPTSPLTDGSHAATVSATDSVGNESPISGPTTILIDTAAPTLLDAPTMTAATDTGVSNADRITSNTQPHFSGDCTTGDTVSLYIDGVIAGQAVCTVGATYEISPSVALNEGTYVVTVTATDIAGNESTPSTATTITIDTTAPTTPSLVTPADGSATNDPNVIVTGTGETDSFVEVLVDSVAVACNEGTVVVTGGSWSCTFTQPLDDGTYSITANAHDLAGNTSANATAHTLTIDTTAPDAPDTPVLDPASDTGVSNSDHITSDTTPTITGTCTDGDTIHLAVDDTELASALCTGGVYSITLPVALSEGEHSIVATATDPVGNTSLPSPALTITIITTNPTISTPTMTAATDSGRSSTDSITNVTTPAFEGSCTNNYTVTLFIDGVVADVTTCTLGIYTLPAPSSLADGDHNITVTTTDIAGNESNQSPTLLVTIDTVAPAKSNLSAPTDNNMTNDTTPIIQGDGESDTIVGVFLNNTPIVCDEDPVIAIANSWTCTPTTPLSDDTYVVKATLTDVAGNTSAASDTRTFTVDTTPPTALATPDMTPETDSGISNTDNITNVTQPDFTGSCTSGFTVTLLVDGAVTDSIACSGSSYTLQPQTALAQGTYDVTATTTDLAGNTSTPSTALPITILTDSPVAPATLSLAAASDSGRSNTDQITNVTTPHFVGACGNNTTVQLWIDGIANGQATCVAGTYDVIPLSPLSTGNHEIRVQAIDLAGNASTQSAPITITIDITAPAAPTITYPANGSTISNNMPHITGGGENDGLLDVRIDSIVQTCGVGSITTVVANLWSCIKTATMPDATYTLTAAQTDVAGNASATATSIFTIDTSPPPTPGTPDLLASSDTGASNTDNYTSDTTPSFSGSCTGTSTVKLYADTTLAAQGTCTSSTYNLTSTTAFTDGEYDVTATATNDSGITSPASAALHVTIDTTVPTAPGTPDMTAATDSGRSNTDNITNVTQPHFTGTCTASTLELRSNSTIIGVGTCVSGAYELVPASSVADGTYSITATIVSLSGVQSTASGALSVTIDTTAPALPVIVVPATNALVNNNKTTMSGTGETDAILHFYVNNAEIVCSQAATIIINGGVWTCTPSVAMSEGANTLKASQTDIAGNTSGFTPTKTITVDTVAPARLGRPDLTAATDSGVSNTDNYTNNTMPNFVGTCVNGDVIRLRLNAVVTSQMVCTGSAYSLYPASSLADGVYSFSATATDPAGNVSPVSLSLSVTIATVAPKPSKPVLHPDSDSGLSNSDSITNVTLPTFTGICNQNETVKLTVDGVFQRSVPCYPPFNAQPLDHLSQGTHTATIEVIDIAGNLSGPSDTLVITIDTMAPANPTVTTPASGVTPTVTTTSFTTAGTTEPNAQIIVWESNVKKCESIANSSGAWTCTLTGLTNGTHTYAFSTNDVAGNAGALIVTRNLLVNHP